MKKQFFIGSLLIAILIISCKKDKDFNIHALEGTWIEVVEQADTLLIENSGSDHLLVILKGYGEFSLYSLEEICSDSVYIQDAFSSCMRCGTEYYIDFQSPYQQFSIGNFIPQLQDRSQDVLTFRKL